MSNINNRSFSHRTELDGKTGFSQGSNFPRITRSFRGLRIWSSLGSLSGLIYKYYRFYRYNTQKYTYRTHLPPYCIRHKKSHYRSSDIECFC